jgi:hypothetical protein
MTPLLSIKAKASGLFALDKDIKVRRGATLGIKRNRFNMHGKKLPASADL